MIGGGGGGGGGEPPPPSSSNSGGQFLLQLLQKPQSQPPPQPLSTTTHHQHQQHQHPHLDPAVAAMGPTLPFPSNDQDLHRPPPPPPPWQSPNPTNSPFQSNFLPPPPPWALSGVSPPLHPPSPASNFVQNFPFLPHDLQRLGLLGNGKQSQLHLHQEVEQQQKLGAESRLMFGSVESSLSKNSNRGGVAGVNVEAQFGQFGVQKVREVGGASGRLNGSEVGFSSNRNWEFDYQGNSHGGQYNQNDQGGGGGGGVGVGVGGSGGGGWGRRQQPVQSAPPGFHQKQKALDQQSSMSGRREIERNEDRELGGRGELNRRMQGDGSSRLGLNRQLDHPGPPVGSKLHSVPAFEIEKTLGILHGQAIEEDRWRRLERQENRSRDEVHGPNYRMDGRMEQDELAEKLMETVISRERFEKKNGIIRHNNGSRDKDFRPDMLRELNAPQRTRNHRRVVGCRSDIDRLNAPFLSIFESLVPAEEEKAKQKQLLTLLEKLVNKEWPKAELYLYGSCANSFGVSKSDIDVCLAIKDVDTSKSEILLKLADILQSDNLENVQALTRARVPIVKLMDPVTGISCDICINNVLAVVNTKLLRDYAQIDGRLRQLAFIVKHWAKSRGVNVTYQGTLSSYAYVLMCIHFLQQRKPAILPCLQGMDATYVVTIDDIECAYFDQVENLRDFGVHNKESIAQLVWAFFDYWAFRHDYANAVISVRTGSVISKREKDWTRRIGNDRHLICIEDPFEVSHDLGRVVDKYSIRTLREEFERAANILQYDPDPCVTLFEPYIPPPS